MRQHALRANDRVSEGPVENLDAICSIPGGSVIFIGPNDSSLLKDIMTTTFTALRKG